MYDYSIKARTTVCRIILKKLSSMYNTSNVTKNIVLIINLWYLSESTYNLVQYYLISKQNLPHPNSLFASHC